MDVVLTWLKPDGKPLLTETRRMTFYTHPELRIIDFDFDFAAIDKVVFRDTKEGTFAMRMATPLEEPPAKEKPGGPARTGKLVNAQGGEREANVWGKQSEWLDYSGVLDGEKVGVVMMDHPATPTSDLLAFSRLWIALNKSVRSARFPERPETGRSLTVEPGRHVRFRYRVIVHPGVIRRGSQTCISNTRRPSIRRRTSKGDEPAISTVDLDDAGSPGQHLVPHRP